MSSRIFYNSQSETIQLGRRVGIGGEGTVYEILDHSDLVAKIYHKAPPPEKAEKLIALSRLGADRLFNLSAWPVDVLRDQALPADGGAPDGGANDNILGFLMKKIGEAEEVHALHSPKSRLQKFPDASWAFLIYVAANIARAVSVIHEHGYVVGDVNPKNILVTRKATVFLLDCDSFQISVDGKTYRCEGGFPEYTPPELQGVAFKDIERNQTHDSFGLAVVIFQLLFLGRHPFSGRFSGAGEMPLERAIREGRFAFGNEAASREMQPPPGTLALDAIPASITELFRRAFLSPHRPHARDWIEPLELLAKSLKKCNLHTGHHFFQELAACPWCEIEFRARIRLFNFGAATNQNRGHFHLDEIWKEIETVATTSFQTLAPIPQTSFPSLVKLSEPAQQFVQKTRRVTHLSLWVAGLMGFVAGYIGGPCFGLILLIGEVFLLRKIAGVKRKPPQPPQSLMAPQLPKSDDPFALQIEAAKQKAENQLRQLEERWEKKASRQRFQTSLTNLQSQKDTYQNLPQIRARRLEELESSQKAQRFEEYLSQFDLSETNIAGVSLATQILLRSYGIETAADLTPPKLEQVRRTDKVGAKSLQGWRWEVARQFEFDPATDVPAQARLTVEREINELQVRLEHEMSAGAYHLRRVKQDIEDAQRKLQPLLAGAQKSLVQSEKDYEAVSKPASAKLATALLIIAFLFGLSVNMDWPFFPQEISQENYQTYYPPPVAEPQIAVSKEDEKLALQLYRKGLKASERENFEDAADLFLRATAVNPRLGDAHQEHGYALYRLGRYKDSIVYSEKAIKYQTEGLHFEPFYYLGLAHSALNDSINAKHTFLTSIAHLPDESKWEEKHIDAYYQLATILQGDEIQAAIISLENVLRTGAGGDHQQFELGNLYLRAGRTEEANQKYEELKQKNQALAAALKKLMAKYGIHEPRFRPAPTTFHR